VHLQVLYSTTIFLLVPPAKHLQVLYSTTIFLLVPPATVSQEALHVKPQQQHRKPMKEQLS
jgi:hypothetical protein